MTLLLFAMAILLVGAVAVLLLSRTGLNWSWLATGSVVIAAGLGSIPAVQALLGGPVEQLHLPWSMPFGEFFIELDPLSAWFLIPTLLLSALSAIYGVEYLRSWEGKRSLGPVWFNYCLLVLGMVLVLVARNAVLFLVAWELMALASFFLVTFEHEKESVREAGWIYFVATHLGTAFLLAFFLLLARETGSMDFDVWAKQGIHAQGLASVLFLLAVIGFGTKAGFMPLHVWLPEAHPAAPSHVSALMSGVMIKTGIYGLLRAFTFLGHAAVVVGVGTYHHRGDFGRAGRFVCTGPARPEAAAGLSQRGKHRHHRAGPRRWLAGHEHRFVRADCARIRRRITARGQSRLVQRIVVPRRGRGVARHRNA